MLLLDSLDFKTYLYYNQTTTRRTNYFLNNSIGIDLSTLPTTKTLNHLSQGSILCLSLNVL